MPDDRLAPRRGSASGFYVVDEDGDSLHITDAKDATDAAERAIAEWDLQGEPGYRIHVFAAADAQEHELAQTVRRVA